MTIVGSRPSRYDHTSVLRFLERRFLGAPAEGTDGEGWWLTTRDRNAQNMGASPACAEDPAAEGLA